MSEALPRPLPKVFDRLGRGGLIQSAQVLITANDAHDFNIDNVRRRMIGIRGESMTNAFSQCPVGYHLIDTGRVNYQH